HMLSAIGILTNDEFDALARVLDELLQRWKDGSFSVAKDDEDGHTAIELYLTQQLGDIGKKVHSGRSRNDQALVMMRLYLKDNLEKVAHGIESVIQVFDKKIQVAGDQAMPGYTHSQKAMPSSVAMWLASYRDAFNDVRQYLVSTSDLIDQNPLGSAAGFGVDIKLDRAMTTKELGFAKVQENPMYCGLSRGLFELAAVQSLNLVMAYAGKFADDMLRFTMQEFDFFSLPASMTTGSSIMPHKRNYDVFEIMRGKAHQFSSYGTAIQMIATGVGSGYHRDLQLTKGVTLEAFSTVLDTLDVLGVCVQELAVNNASLDAAMTDELQTVAKINKLVDEGVPFRDAYRKVKKDFQG
nr:argininosuccinate lyase [Candidatus Saccharibacteria bacterium]